jgi:hypothetical protein
MKAHPEQVVVELRADSPSREKVKRADHDAPSSKIALSGPV